jgi:cysteine desulfurase / selenocysteine lyase
MKPYQVGGGMIQKVSIKETIYADPPQRFEAGTPDIAGIIAFKKSLEYLNSIGLEKIAAYEKQLLNYATKKLIAIPGVRLFGMAKEKVAVISFLLDDLHPHDLGTVLDSYGIAIRAGHHCAMPLMENLGIAATARVSFSFYNTFAEIDSLIKAIIEVKKFFKK